MTSPRQPSDEKTSEEKIRNQMELVEKARQLYRANNSLRDPSVLSQSSAYLELAQQENDRAIARVIMEDVIKDIAVKSTQQRLESSEKKIEAVSSSVSSSSGVSSSSSSSSTMTSLSKASYNDKAENEVMQVCHFPPGLPEIIVDYLDGNVDTEEDNEIKPLPVEQRQQLTFLGRNFCELMAYRVAKLTLSGEQEDVDEAVALVKKNPTILNYTVRVTNPKGRTIEGKPLQIAGIAGDFDLKEGLSEKDRGVVERLALAAGLSKEEIDKQLKVITSEEAIKANEARNQRVLAAVKAFAEGILKVKETIDANNSLEAKEDKDSNTKQKQMSFEDFKTLCQPVIDQLEKALQPDPKEVIRSGYIFDPKILRDATKWFEDNVTRFSGWWSNQSDVFWVNGIGKLQDHLSARDKQVTRAGIANFVDHGIVPGRRQKNAGMLGPATNSKSGLGVDFYFGYCGGARDEDRRLQFVETYVEQKQQHCKAYATSRQSKEAENLPNNVARF